MKWGTKIKYTAFIVLCSLAFAVSGISGVFSSFKTEGTSGFSIYYTAPKPVNLQAIQFYNSYSTATSITFDYYNDEYNEIIASATTSKAVDENSNGSIMLYQVGTDIYVLSSGEIYANATCYRMFYNLTKLTSIKFNNFDTSNVTNMSYMFRGCSGLTSLDISGWDTSNVTNMAYMFQSCSGLTTIYVGDSFSTINVTSSTSMFYSCSKLVGGDGTAYNSSYVDNTLAAVAGGYLTHINSKLFKMYASEATIITFDYYSSQYDEIIANADATYEVEDDNIGKCTLYIEGTEVYILSNNTITPKSGSFMLYGLKRLKTINFNNFDTSNVTSMVCMFWECSRLTSLDLSGWNTTSVTYMSCMFYNCSKLTSLDLSGWDTSNVTDMSFMFSTCSVLTTIYVGDSWSTTNVGLSIDMFFNCPKLVGGNGTVYNGSYIDKTYARIDKPGEKGYLTAISDTVTLIRDTQFNNITSTATSITFDYYNDEYNAVISNADATYLIGASTEDKAMLYIVGTDIYILSNSEIYAHSNCSYMFSSMTALKSITFNNFNTSNVTIMDSMFDNCSKLTRLDLSSFNTSNVTDMEWMFFQCYGLTSLDLSGWDTSNVTDMSYMFSGCSGFTSLDLSGFNTSKVTYMSYMFNGCGGLTTIYVSSSWSTTNVAYSTGMFYDCTKLVGGNGTKYNSSYINKTYARIDKAGEPGYLTAKQ